MYTVRQDIHKVAVSSTHKDWWKELNKAEIRQIASIYLFLDLCFVPSHLAAQCMM